MGLYTTELRAICEYYAGLSNSVGYKQIPEIINDSFKMIFDFDFPIFDESYRDMLEKKIIYHFYTREICEETLGLWKLRLRNKMNEIMPYYNQLYKSELIKFNPLYDTDITTNRNVVNQGKEKTDNGTNATDVNQKDITRDTSGTNDGTQNDVNTASRGNTDLFSDTPQNGLTDVIDGNYLTNARVVNEQNKTQGNTSVNNTYSDAENVKENNKNIKSSTSTGSKSTDNMESYSEQVLGNRGGQAFSDLLTKFRNTFLNIDMLVIDELSELFFGLWG